MIVSLLVTIGRAIKASFEGFCRFVTVAAEAQPRVVGLIVLLLIVYGLYKFNS